MTEHEKALDMLKGLFEYCWNRESCSHCIFEDVCDKGIMMFTDFTLPIVIKKCEELEKED